MPRSPISIATLTLLLAGGAARAEGPGEPPAPLQGTPGADASAAPARLEPAAPVSPMTVERARALVRRPRGSTSVGSTSSGSVIGGVALALEGEGWSVFHHMRKRKTNYGTRELVTLIGRVAGAVARAYPGSVLGVGNLGFRQGGKIPWSVSHRAGRDADVGMFALDQRGERTELEGFVSFGRDLLARGGRYRYDLKRNLALVRALVEGDAGVQYIFVAEWLKQPLLEEARRQALPGDLIARLDAVLHQPSDSNPHSDHYHIRLHCTPEDRLHGCLDRGPRRAWVDHGDDAFDAHVAALIRAVTELDQHPKVRRRAIAKLGALRADAALPTLLGALEDPRSDIRKAALRSVRAIADLGALDDLLAIIARTPDAKWAAKLFGAVRRFNSPRLVSTALRAVSEPASLLHPDAVAGAGPALQVDGARILGRFGRREAFEPLLALLSAPRSDVREAGHAALQRVTNQRISGRGLASRSKRRRARVIKAWRRFYDRERNASWLQWMRLGFEARRVRFSGKMVSAAGVERLIRAISMRDDVGSDNAIRVLSEITGHYVDPTWRNKRNNQRHWRSWWRAHRHEVSLR